MPTLPGLVDADILQGWGRPWGLRASQQCPENLAFLQSLLWIYVVSLECSCSKHDFRLAEPLGLCSPHVEGVTSTTMLYDMDIASCSELREHLQAPLAGPEATCMHIGDSKGYNTKSKLGAYLNMAWALNFYEYLLYLWIPQQHSEALLTWYVWAQLLPRHSLSSWICWCWNGLLLLRLKKQNNFF